MSSRDGARPVAQRHKDGSTNAPAARMDARGSDGVATQHSARRRQDGTHDIARFGRDMQCAPLGARRRDLERDCRPLAILTRTLVPNGPLRAGSARVWFTQGHTFPPDSHPFVELGELAASNRCLRREGSSECSEARPSLPSGQNRPPAQVRGERACKPVIRKLVPHDSCSQRNPGGCCFSNTPAQGNKDHFRAKRGYRSPAPGGSCLA